MVQKKRVLMVCTGNICRSPIAEAIFKYNIDLLGLNDSWEVESAAIVGYHTGRSPDPRAIATLEENGITNYSHKARTVNINDFTTFDWIFGMDNSNIEELNNMKPANCTAKIELLGKYDPEEEIIIKDPYYMNNNDGFYAAYEQSDRSIRAFFLQFSEHYLRMYRISNNL